MQSSLASARRHQIIFLILLTVCLAQVGWWMIDQWLFSGEVQGRLQETHRRSLDAAKVMLEQGIATNDVAKMFPALSVSKDGNTIRVKPTIMETLTAERDSRRNRYAWEGGFFLIVLCAAIGVLWRTVRTEVRLRQRQRNFVTAVTHELKSPLASVRLSAETLQYRENDPETRERLIERLLNSLDRMDATVSNILDTTQIDEGKLALEPQTVMLSPCIYEIVNSLETVAENAGVKMEIAADNGLTVYADHLALTVVLRNLIANGIDAAAGVENATVTIKANKADSKTVVEVSDNGRGFHSTEGEKLFEKFYRLGNEIRREGRGTGLGLYIARSLVAESGGELSAHSDGPGRGALFRATWPRIQQDGRPPKVRT
jgi:signal transduction histidine kinase